MSQLNLKIKKVPLKNPKTQEPGYAPRLITNGTADFADIATTFINKLKVISENEMLDGDWK